MTINSALLFCKNHFPCRDYDGFACCEHLDSGKVSECKFCDQESAKNCSYYRPETDPTLIGLSYKNNIKSNK
jgi:hypothetical protein